LDSKCPAREMSRAQSGLPADVTGVAIAAMTPRNPSVDMGPSAMQFTKELYWPSVRGSGCRQRPDMGSLVPSQALPRVSPHPDIRGVGRIVDCRERREAHTSGLPGTVGRSFHAQQLAAG